MTVRIIYINKVTHEEFNTYEAMKIDMAKKYGTQPMWNVFYDTRVENI